MNITIINSNFSLCINSFVYIFVTLFTVDVRNTLSLHVLLFTGEGTVYLQKKTIISNKIMPKPNIYNRNRSMHTKMGKLYTGVKKTAKREEGRRYTV